ncbi:MAG: hypothetical protein L0Y79_12910 [Chlorobi bacterium]|nr:hypothetical protein [Chlorobiota bacterium]MCI0714854.1 hypothetical protein [Chlorobiota bacterium]
MLRFILKSYSFKRILVISAAFIVIFWISNKIFDYVWGSSSSIPIVNLDDIYKPPEGYNNYTKINIKLITKDRVAIEGNKRFKTINSRKNFEYYDTVSILYPETEFSYTNKIFMQFEQSNYLDSLFLVVSKSTDENLYWKQIFYSSVIVHKINRFSENIEEFRINNDKLVNTGILEDNDSLISEVYKYFNKNAGKLEASDCGRNSELFKTFCSLFNVPCRIVGLQGGDADQTGYFYNIGYPLHALCEIYSSKQKKWFIVDPSYGFRYRVKSGTGFLNAVEVSNKHTFSREYEIIQDSILITKRSLVGKDYFKFYENIYYRVKYDNPFIQRLYKFLYGKFNYHTYHYSNQYPVKRDGNYYVASKSFMYLIVLILYINSSIIVLIKRLLLVKKPK